jgi:phosphatidylglycerol:prolipoprotein diacylglycerol transferase
MPSPNDPVAFTLFGVGVRWYAIFILAGIVAAVALVRWLALRRGMDPDFPLDAAPVVVVAGIIGARGYYLLLQWDYFRANPEQTVNLRLGGLTIHGALALGIPALLLYCRRRGQRFLAWADLVVPGVALGQALGRWGNWANQEAFGRPTGFPWGLAIDPERRPAAFADASHFHPTFLYESVFNLANAVLLSWLALRLPRSRFLREGDVLWLYLILYGLARFAIEPVRTDSLTIGPFPAASWFSAGLVIVGVVMLFGRRLAPRPFRDPVPRAARPTTDEP